MRTVLARRIAQAALLATAGALFALTAAQRLVDAPWPLLELSRYLPYYWLAVPCLVAAGLGLWLGRGWIAAGALPVLCLFGVTMAPSVGGWTRASAARAEAAADASSRTAAAGTASAPATFRLTTWNVKAVAGLGGGRLDRIAAEVLRADPDVLVMQDADGLRVRRDAPAEVGTGVALFGLPQVYALGQYVVASRLPLQGCEPGQIGYGLESHRYLRCRILVGGEPVTLVTAHFRSPRGGLMATRADGTGGLDDWRRNLAERLQQADALARDLRAIDGPRIVAGDLNADDASPVVRRLLDTGLRDAHAAAGVGYGYTYGQSFRAGLSFLRIDHVLTGGGIVARACEVGAGDVSEHRPVTCDLERRPDGGSATPAP